MENKDKPAFPEPYINDPNLALSIMPGLTKREYFAAIAITGVVYNSSSDPGQVARSIELALIYADELLKQLEDGKH